MSVFRFRDSFKCLLADATAFIASCTLLGLLSVPTVFGLVNTTVLSFLAASHSPMLVLTLDVEGPGSVPASGVRLFNLLSDLVVFIGVLVVAIFVGGVFLGRSPVRQQARLAPSTTSPNSTTPAPIVPEITGSKVSQPKWLTQDISGTGRPRAPVLGLPVMSSPRSISRARFWAAVSENPETVRNRNDVHKHRRGLYVSKTLATHVPWFRSYGLSNFCQDGGQLSKLDFRCSLLRIQVR
ncbi:hypothetical protein ACJJTC_013151 [Scirpophaga incertulas]